ncbi:MAG: M55 family metallopeptidase [Vicinamibacteria bacterium]|nr:M55 family metallopeptidase [Vicinamibacteria bacterium]
MTLFRAAALAASVLLTSPLAAAPPAAKLKVFISVDMEGVAGTVTGDQLGPSGFEYARFREFMTKEALAAVQAAKDSGATEIVVADAHGNGENLLIEQFPDDVRIVRSWPRPLGMMGGLDQTFDAAILVGYHASTDNPRGVRAHTFSSARLHSVQLNGQVASEGAFNAAIAGHFGVPVIFVSGDDAAVAEVRQQVGAVETVETKRHLGFHAAETLTPAAAAQRIGAGVRKALARRGDFKPYRLTAPITLDITFKNYRPAEVAAYLKGIERMDSHTIRFRGADMVEISNFQVFLSNFSLELEP